MDSIAAEDGGGAVIGVGLVGYEVDFAKEPVKRWVLVDFREASNWSHGGGKTDFCSWCLSLRTIVIEWEGDFKGETVIEVARGEPKSSEKAYRLPEETLRQLFDDSATRRLG